MYNNEKAKSEFAILGTRWDIHKEKSENILISRKFCFKCCICVHVSLQVVNGGFNEGQHGNLTSCKDDLAYLVVNLHTDIVKTSNETPANLLVVLF